MAKISMVTPATRSGSSGNWVTAERWSRLLRELGHEVRLRNQYDDATSDVLVAVHARRSAASIERFHRSCPGKPIVVLLAGTDVYGDLHHSAPSRRALTLRSLRLATRIVTLQPLALREIPVGLRRKAVVIFQSAARTASPAPKRNRTFDVAVLAHLRRVKDPMRAAYAARLLPAESNLRIVHAGRALTADFESRARREMQRNPRYLWHGALTPGQARRLLARARLLVVSSRLEGGANVVSEAVAAGIPVLGSKIPGTVGLLGTRYPGYFEVGDTRGLAQLLLRSETDSLFLANLQRHVLRLAPHFQPKREQKAWKELLTSVGITR